MNCWFNKNRNKWGNLVSGYIVPPPPPLPPRVMMQYLMKFGMYIPLRNFLIQI